jgi:hypothetical protein
LLLSIPGWQRFRPAEEWLSRHNMLPLSQATEVDKMLFERFIAEKMPAGSTGGPMQGELFRQFLEWRKRNEAKR